MKNTFKEKRVKYTTETYMKETLDYKVLVIKSDEDYYVTIKKYDRVISPIAFVVGFFSMAVSEKSFGETY